MFAGIANVSNVSPEFRGRAGGPEGLPASVRSSLRALLARLAAGESAPEMTSEEGAETEAAVAAAARSFESKLRRLRANAHAAYHSVEGAEAAALDAALAVIETEWHVAQTQRDSYAEALKTIRLYARDPEVRELAGWALGAEGPAVARTLAPREADGCRRTATETLR